MPVNVVDAKLQTIFFSGLITLILLFTLRKKISLSALDIDTTTELKGLAILAIVLSHIGYFLSTDHDFLFPLSILAGLGVNVFLFLSGFGLMVSSTEKPLSILNFYLKRLRKIFIPMWIVITVLFLADFFVLGRTYKPLEILSSYLGFFPKADLYINLNAPLWYFSFILFYYLLFPIIFLKKYPVVSVILMMVLSFIFSRMVLPVDFGVNQLYKVHFLAFPLGMLLAIFSKRITKIPSLISFVLIPVFIFVFAYTAINSGVGQGLVIEQATSLVTLFSLLGVFILKRWQFKFLMLLGVYSYEIYLIHWPLLYRYDWLYKFLPPALATLLYIFLFLALGVVLQRLTSKLKG